MKRWDESGGVSWDGFEIDLKLLLLLGKLRDNCTHYKTYYNIAITFNL